MKKLTVNPDTLVFSILYEHKVMPLKEVYVRCILVDPLSPTITATARVEENAVVSPWKMGLEITRIATRGFRPKPNGRGTLNRM